MFQSTPSLATILKVSAIALVASMASGAAQAGDLNHRGSLKDPVERQGRLPEPEAPVERAISWTGFYIGGQVGYSNSNHNLSASDTIDKGTCKTAAGIPVSVANKSDCATNGATNVWTPDIKEVASAFLDGVNSHGLFGGGTIGGDIQRGNLLFGVFGDYNFSSAEAEAGYAYDFGLFGKGDGSASIEDGDSWVVAARAGYLFGSEKRALLYVLGGYGQQDVTYTVGKDSKDVTFSGFVAGAGGEYALTQNVFIGIEWQHFFGGEEDIVNENGNFGGIHGPATNSRISDDLDSDKVMAKVKLKLNSELNDMLR